MPLHFSGCCPIWLATLSVSFLGFSFLSSAGVLQLTGLGPCLSLIYIYFLGDFIQSEALNIAQTLRPQASNSLLRVPLGCPVGISKWTFEMWVWGLNHIFKFIFKNKNKSRKIVILAKSRSYTNISMISMNYFSSSKKLDQRSLEILVPVNMWYGIQKN